MGPPFIDTRSSISRISRSEICNNFHNIAHAIFLGAYLLNY